MYLSFGKINISIKNAIFIVLALILSIFLAYYLNSDDDENKLENFGD